MKQEVGKTKANQQVKAQIRHISLFKLIRAMYDSGSTLTCYASEQINVPDRLLF